MQTILHDEAVVAALLRRARALPAAGLRIGKLVVGSEFGYVVSGAKPRLTLLCACDCGASRHLYVQYLRTGRAKSCGCAASETARAKGLAPGYRMTRDPLYWVWRGMKQRCEDRNHQAFRYYGRRGIRVEPPWDQDFAAFRTWALAKGYAAGLTIDRRDTNGPYSADNCRWATMKTQARNTRRNAMLTAFGETKTVSEWAEDARCTISASVLYARRELGWDDQRSVTEPKAVAIVSTSAFGETKTLKEWSRDPRCAVSYKVLWQRLNRYGLAPEVAITAPGRIQTTVDA